MATPPETVPVAPAAAPPPLFDETLYAQRQARATEPLFHRLSAEMLCDRLDEVNRRFTDAALISHQPGIWVDRLAAHPRVATLSHHLPAPLLPLRPGSCDLVVLGLWLHASNDPLGALIQARRALRPDGLLLAPVFGGQTLRELRSALAGAEAETLGGLSPRVAPMAEIRDLGALLQRAGFAMPVADADRTELRYAGMLALMRDLRRMGETNVLAGRLRRPTRRAVIARAAGLYDAAHRGPDGRVAARFEIVWLTGWAPGPDQPQPKRRGSASARLADALGVAELSAGEKAG
ncbi:MAG: methyltransferase domain-containing protein [Pseudomonadota bacterium]